MAPPIVWSIAGHDSSGGAGLSADQRAADAFGVHLCPVVAATTAQHSQGVQAVHPLPADQINAQLRALAADLPPRAIKTGLLASVEAITCVAHWVDHLRSATPAGHDPHQQLALIIDPVLGASSGGAAFSNAHIVQAYREHLLPRATLITPNHTEACRLLGRDLAQPDARPPALAHALRELGARSVAITGGDTTIGSPHRTHSIDWIDTPHAHGWLTAPRLHTPHLHGTGCTFATSAAAAIALGHVEADALVLAKMATHHAIAHGHAAGGGAGPVIAQAGFAAGVAHGGAPLPWLGCGHALPWQLTTDTDAAAADATAAPLFHPFAPPPDGLYGILPTAAHIDTALRSGLRCLQLRHKSADGLDAHIEHLARLAPHAPEAQLFINDHWRHALRLLHNHSGSAGINPGAAIGIHLGQEDLLALSDDDRTTLLAQRHRLMLGLSSHSLWELARAAGCGASLIACGPVQPTTTKDMPWQPQGQRNLRWWVSHSPVPVVAIGGLLDTDDLRCFAACHPAALCVVRALQQPIDAHSALAPILSAWRHAIHAARSTANHMPAPITPLPHPTL